MQEVRHDQEREQELEQELERERDRVEREMARARRALERARSRSHRDEAERITLFEATVRLVKGRCKIIAGVGTNDTAQSLRLLEGARRVGAGAGPAAQIEGGAPGGGVIPDRAHELGRTRDWVVIYYYDEDHREGQNTVVTETHGPRRGERVVRGRERER